MPVISSITPNTAPGESSFTLTIAGFGLQAVHDIEFHLVGAGTGGGMMGGGMSGSQAQNDPNIHVSNVQANSTGTQITSLVQISPTAQAGTRQIRLDTDYGPVMGMMTDSLFTVTK